MWQRIWGVIRDYQERSLQCLEMVISDYKSTRVPEEGNYRPEKRLTRVLVVIAGRLIAATILA